MKQDLNIYAWLAGVLTAKITLVSNLLNFEQKKDGSWKFYLRIIQKDNNRELLRFIQKQLGDGVIQKLPRGYIEYRLYNQELLLKIIQAMLIKQYFLSDNAFIVASHFCQALKIQLELKSLEGPTNYTKIDQIYQSQLNDLEKLKHNFKKDTPNQLLSYSPPTCIQSILTLDWLGGYLSSKNAIRIYKYSKNEWKDKLYCVFALTIDKLYPTTNIALYNFFDIPNNNTKRPFQIHKPESLNKIIQVLTKAPIIGVHKKAFNLWSNVFLTNQKLRANFFKYNRPAGIILNENLSEGSARKKPPRGVIKQLCCSQSKLIRVDVATPPSGADKATIPAESIICNRSIDQTINAQKVYQQNKQKVYKTCQENLVLVQQKLIGLQLVNNRSKNTKLIIHADQLT